MTTSRPFTASGGIPVTAKERLDRLIGKSRADLYKPIAIAEILYRSRIEKNIDLNSREQYRRRSYEWMREVVLRLHNKTAVLNSRYWDQTFDPAVIPPPTLVELGALNDAGDGIVETYIFGHVRSKFAALTAIRNELKDIAVEDFRPGDFLAKFEADSRFRRSVDKAYEIVVYALFNAVVTELDAKVTLSVATDRSPVLADFEDFARLVLGVDRDRPAVSHPARLFRVGTANANDAGLDMWANFGPAVQVKHLSLSPDQVGEICQGVQADQVLIACKSAEADKIEILIQQLGLGDKLRGIITEIDLEKWYRACCSDRYKGTLGRRVIDAIDHEMRLEFPLGDTERVDDFLRSRGYDIGRLTGAWAIDEG